MEQGKHPIHLLCPECGAPVKYNIKDDFYHCSYCGADTPPGEQIKRIERWRSVSRKRLQQEIKTADAVLYSCPGCGAEVIVKEGEAAGTCSFCTGSLVRSEFSQSVSFPESVIPFQITLDEAKDKLSKWISSHGSMKEKTIVKKNIDKLEGYYLPYQFVRGPIGFEVVRDISKRKYHCGGYINEIAINTSKQLRNEVLDAAEPFNWDECREFNFGYVAGHRVKTQDITDTELSERTKKEVELDYLPVVEKTMHTKGLELYAGCTDLEQLPVLLPMYIISQQNLSVAVNGQTGAVAVSLNEKMDTNRFWFIEPLLTTIIPFLVVLFWMHSIEFALMAAAVVGCIAFVAFGQDRQKHLQLKVNSENKNTDKDTKHAIPIFREVYNGKPVDVEIHFFNSGRVIRNIIGLILFNILPLLIAIFFQWSQSKPISELHFGYISIWLILSIPFTFIFWIAYLRRDVYDHPLVYRISEDGNKKRIRVKNPDLSFIESIKEEFKHFNRSDFFSGLLIIILPVIMFIMSIVLMMGA